MTVISTKHNSHHDRHLKDFKQYGQDMEQAGLRKNRGCIDQIFLSEI